MEIVPHVIHPDSNPILYAMLTKDDVETLRLVDEFGINTLDGVGENCLFKALYAQRLDLFDELVRRGAEFVINCEGTSVLGCISDESPGEWEKGYPLAVIRHILSTYGDRIKITINDLNM